MTRHLACLPVIAGSTAGSLQAANGSWVSGRVGEQSWNDPLNWLNGIIPGSTSGTANADTATFGSNTGAAFILIDAGRNVRNMLFSNNNAGIYTLGGATANAGESLHLSSGGNITLGSSSTTALNLNAPLILEAASSSADGVYSILNNSTNVASSGADTNTYKITVASNISGGVTTGKVTLMLAGTAGNRQSNASANILSGLISNGGAAQGLGLQVGGADGGNRGAWSLTNDANSFTGPVVVGGGSLLVSSIADAGTDSAAGAGDVIQLNSSSHFKYVGPAASTNRTILANGTSFYSSGTGALTLTGPVILNGSLGFRGSSNFIVDTVISGTGNVSRTDGGTVFLNQINTFSGTLTVAQGAFRIGTIADAGTDSAIGRGNAIRFGQNTTSEGTLEFNGLEGGSTNREIQMVNGSGGAVGNGRINHMVAGQTLFFSGNVKATSATVSDRAHLTLAGVGDGVLSGVIGGTTNSATASTPNNLRLTKEGTGTWALSNANIYYGGTTISAGTLLVSNTTGSATGSGNVNVSGSTAVLGGTGIVGGSSGAQISVAANSRLMIGTTHGIAAGAAGPAGTTAGPGQLTLGSATDVALSLLGTMQFDLFSGANGTPALADRLILQTTATSITLGGDVVVADTTGARTGTWFQGSWQLFDWSGTGAATLNGTPSFTLPTTLLASGYSWNTDDLFTTGMLSIEKNAGATHTWTGAVSNSWNDAGNWEAGTLPSSSTDVLFGAAPIVSHQINGNKNVRNMFFTGQADHTIGGGGGVLYAYGSLFEVIGGSQRLTVQLRPRTAGIYEFKNEGTLAIGSAMFHRSGSAGDLTFVFSGSGNTTIGNLQRREANYQASVVVNGPGQVTITGFANDSPEATSFAIRGTTTLNGGTLRIQDERSLGLEPEEFNEGHLTLNGGTLAAYGSMVMDDANRGVTVGANGGAIAVEPGFTFTLASPLTGLGALEKNDTGLLILAGPNTHSGSLTVTGGSLQAGVNGVGNAGTGAITVASGAFFAGSGTLENGAFTLQNGATLQAGDFTTGTDTGFGRLTFAPEGAGTYRLETGSKIRLGLSGTESFDSLSFAGGAGSSLDFSGILEVFADGYVPAEGDVFDLLDWSVLVEVDFSNFVVGANRDGSLDDDSQFNLPDISGSGYLWDVGQFLVNGSVFVVVVPEPGRAMLMVAGLGFVLLRRRRGGK